MKTFNDAELTAFGMGTSACVPCGARTVKTVWPDEGQHNHHYPLSYCIYT